MNEINERFKKAMEFAKGVWWVVMFFTTLAVFAYAPRWAILLLFPFALVSYAIIFIITMNSFVSKLSPEELEQVNAEKQKLAQEREKLDVVKDIADRQAAGENIPADEVLEKLSAAGITDIVKVTALGPVVGTYRDKNIYEYIVVKMQKNKEDDKLMYYGPANIVDGVAQIPVFDGMIFACVDDILYFKETVVQQK